METPMEIAIENPWTTSWDKNCSTMDGSSWEDLWSPWASIASNDLLRSIGLGNFSGIAVQHPCDENLGELVETWVVAQQGSELCFERNSEPKASDDPACALEEALEAVVDLGGARRCAHRLTGRCRM